MYMFIRGLLSSGSGPLACENVLSSPFHERKVTVLVDCSVALMESTNSVESLAQQPTESGTRKGSLWDREDLCIRFILEGTRALLLLVFHSCAARWNGECCASFRG